MSKDTTKRSKKSFLRFAGIASVIFLVFICFVKRDNLFRWIQAGLTVRRQEKQIEFYEADIERLHNEVRSLTTDKDSLEKYARENFYLAAPDEDVYIDE